MSESQPFDVHLFLSNALESLRCIPVHHILFVVASTTSFGLVDLASALNLDFDEIWPLLLQDIVHSLHCATS